MKRLTLFLIIAVLLLGVVTAAGVTLTSSTKDLELNNEDKVLLENIGITSIQVGELVCKNDVCTSTLKDARLNTYVRLEQTYCSDYEIIEVIDQDNITKTETICGVWANYTTEELQTMRDQKVQEKLDLIITATKIRQQQQDTILGERTITITTKK